MRRQQWITILCAAALLVSFGEAWGRVQEPDSPQSTAAPPAPAPAAKASKPGKNKYSHLNDFLIHGTVFTDKALSFPGVQLRIRKVGEKKYRWEDYTDSRGEFAVRVPQGSDYEMVVRVKGFVEQTRTIDAKTGANEQSMVFRMQPATRGKG